MKYPALSGKDKKIYKIIKEEEKRQKEGIELIASENYASKAVLEAMSSVLTNKYSEGYPGKRYYEGNEVIDKMEKLAIERVKKLFDAEYVNIQPLSGSPANFAVYMALLKPGDTILAMKLDHGGHLSHGMHLNISGQLYNIVFYGVDKETERVNMQEVRDLAKKHQPKLIIAGFSAYSRNLDWQAFKDIADEVGAYTLADIAHIAGLIAGKQLDNPVPIFDVVTTTTHKTLRGPRGAMIMAKEKYGKDLNRAIFPGLQGGPHDHINAAKAVCFKEALEPSFQSYAKQVLDNTKVMAESLEKEGLRVVSGGTDNHLVLVDLTSKNITGKKATRVLDEAGISTNMNLIPYDKRPPLDPSGIRLGTAAITTRGMKEEEVKKIVVWINQVLENPDDEGIINSIKQQIKDLTDKFPVPGIE